MSDDLYTSYTSAIIHNNKKEESIYATWSKEKNVWGNNKFNKEISTTSQTSNRYPPPRPILPDINRNLKPNSELLLFREGIVEQSY